MVSQYVKIVFYRINVKINGKFITRRCRLRAELKTDNNLHER